MSVTGEKGAIRVDAALTNIAIGYNPVSDFPLASGKALPIVMVDQETGKYWKFDKNSFREANGRWKPGANGHRVVPYNSSQETYACERYKLIGEVTHEEQRKADKAIQPRIRTTKDVKEMVLRYFESKIATALQDSTTTYSSYTAEVSTAWNIDASTPKADVDDALNSIRKNAAVKPRKCKMILGFDKAQDLANNAAIRDQFKYTSDKSITAEMLARYFGVQEVIIHDEVYNSANEGQTSVMTDIWTSTIVTLLWTPERPDLKSPSAGYLGVEKLYGGKSSRVRSWEDPDKDKEQDLVEVMNSMAVLETANEAVYILTGC